MSHTGTSTRTAQRIERLLRSLVGVSDLRLQWSDDKLRALHILRDARVQPHQLIRNIVSGMQAGIGIAVLPTQVHVHDEQRDFDSVVATPPPPEPSRSAPTPAAPPAPAARTNGNVRTGAPAASVNGTHSGNGHAHPAPAVPRQTHDVPPVALSRQADPFRSAAELVRQHREGAGIRDGLKLERIDIDRRGATLRCRTVLALNGRTYSAIAEVPDAPAAEAELAARVAVDALRAGGLTEATLEGVGFITISDVNYCVTTVREPGMGPRAGAAPMIDSMAASATAAVLTALGTYTDARVSIRLRAPDGMNANL